MDRFQGLKSVAVSVAAAVAELELIGPGKGNAMGPDFWRELPGLFAALDADDDVRAVLVRGSGRMFSSGLDLAAVLGEVGPSLTADGGLAAARTRFYDHILRMQQAMDAVEACRKPVVAAIHGWCIGGGVDLAAACDIRLASADARFSVREVKVAIVADMGSLQRLPHIIGQGHTRDLALTGRDVDAAYAARIGLVSEVLPDAELLVTAARQRCAELAANPPLVVQGVKRVLNDTRDLGVAEGLRHVAIWNAAFLQSHDLGEAMAAFSEKRPAQFQGR